MDETATSPEDGEPTSPERGSEPRLGGAVRVASGIFSSRILGLVRDQLVAYFFGVGGHADAYRAVFRGPNILQNLLGEQSLSASFIPIYSKLLAEGREREAGRFAGAIFGLLLAVAASIALGGVVFAEQIVVFFNPGYLRDAGLVAAGLAEVDRLPLAVRAIRITFPMFALMTLSAWALGVLNSHRRFFISYFSPVLWNSAIIAALLGAGALLLPGGIGGAAEAEAGLKMELLLAACWGGLIGGLLQFAFQVPALLGVMKHFRLSFSTRVLGVREALSRFTPLLAARGAAQLSAYLDFFLASFAATGAQGGLGQAHLLYLLPISLFSLSVAAAELPGLSELSGSEGAAEAVRRARAALRQIAFWVVPTAVGYLGLGYLLIGALFRRGKFQVGENWLVYSILAGYAIGLVATSWSRMLSNVFFAAGETAIPSRIAVGRVAISAAAGAAFMFWFDAYPVSALANTATPLRFGAAGLALGAGISAWIELRLLERALKRRGQEEGEEGVEGAKVENPLRLPYRYARLQTAFGLVALVPASLLWWLVRSETGLPMEIVGAAVLAVYATIYLALSVWKGVPEALSAAKTLRGLLTGGAR